MFKCTGICSTCGKCHSEKIINSTNQRKTKMIEYPSDFVPDVNGGGYGIAFDIGSTTIVGILRNLDSGKQIGIKAKTNPQNEYGMDVISRITFCGQDEKNTDILRSKTVDALNTIIAELCEEYNVKNIDIKSVVMGGNTTMSHIITGHSPLSLARAPFDPEYTGPVKMTQEQSRLNINPDGKVTVFPGIAGHVGGDITSGIVATRFLSMKDLTIFIDIGTNGEIVITDGRKTFACSTAAGPAFEGATILHGMRATNGAIEKTEIKDGEVYFKTIDSCEPVGICGSGLIDVIAEMRTNGLINITGRLLSKEKALSGGVDENLAERLINQDGVAQFILVYKENGEDIVITQKDIREVQLAKGAIAAGIEIMLGKLGKSIADINKIIVAGAFGNYIDKESATAIGLLPDIDMGKIVFAGNAAGTGVSMALANEKEMEFAITVPSRVQHIELAACDDFQNVYLNSMAFPNEKNVPDDTGGGSDGSRRL